MTSLRNLLLAAGLVAALAPAAAAAQTAAYSNRQGGQLRYVPNYAGRVFNPQARWSEYRLFNFQSEAFREQLDRQAAFRAQRATPERQDRALRVGALIDSGQCEAAQQTASAELDRVMAVQARRICESRGRGAAQLR